MKVRLYLIVVYTSITILYLVLPYYTIIDEWPPYGSYLTIEFIQKKTNNKNNNNSNERYIRIIYNDEVLSINNEKIIPLSQFIHQMNSDYILDPISYRNECNISSFINTNTN